MGEAWGSGVICFDIMKPTHTMLFRYDDVMRQALEAIKIRDGASFHEQVKRAVWMWIAAKGLELHQEPHSLRSAALIARAARLPQALAEIKVRDGNTPSPDGEQE